MKSNFYYNPLAKKSKIDFPGVFPTADQGTGRPTSMLFRDRAQANPVMSHALDAKSAAGTQAAPRKELVVMEGQAHQCWGMCPPKRQLCFQARDTTMATHMAARYIQNFLAGGSNSGTSSSSGQGASKL